MECVVLAAGEGKRMRPLTAKRPKVMLPLANRPMMEHLVCAAVTCLTMIAINRDKINQ